MAIYLSAICHNLPRHSYLLFAYALYTFERVRTYLAAKIQLFYGLSKHSMHNFCFFFHFRQLFHPIWAACQFFHIIFPHQPPFIYVNVHFVHLNGRFFDTSRKVQ